VLLVFKTSRWADEVHGEFDSHPLPPLTIKTFNIW
jgi:hypothetical protein